MTESEQLEHKKLVLECYKSGDIFLADESLVKALEEEITVLQDAPKLPKRRRSAFLDECAG